MPITEQNKTLTNLANPDLIVIEPQKSIQKIIIWLHGLGANNQDLIPMTKAINIPQTMHYAYLFPNAPIRPISLFGGEVTRGWFDIYDLKKEKQDEPGIKQAQQQLNKLIEQCEQQGIPSEDIILAGFSQGGALALQTGLNYPKKLGGIIGLSTYLPLKDQYNAKQQSAPIFLAHGKQDEVIAHKIGRTSCEKLQQLGHKITWQSYDMGHQISPQTIQDLAAWLQENLTSQP